MIPNYNINGAYAGFNPVYNPGFQPVTYSPVAINRKSSLTPEELEAAKKTVPSLLDMTFTAEELIPAMCNHKQDDGKEHVFVETDPVTGLHVATCDICGARWLVEPIDQETLDKALDTIDNAMQNSKWISNLSIDFIRQYYTIIPMLKRFKNVFKVAETQLNQIVGANPYMNAYDVSGMAVNNLFGNYGAMYAQQQPGYMDPAQQQMMAQQMAAQQQAMQQQMMAQQQAMLQQQQMMAAQQQAMPWGMPAMPVANPYVNPMLAPQPFSVPGAAQTAQVATADQQVVQTPAPAATAQPIFTPAQQQAPAPVQTEPVTLNIK